MNDMDISYAQIVNKKREYLVDVPVEIMIWTRPEIQKRQFEIIRKARPSKLFLVSDGGRNEKEWEAIKKNRALYENIDWVCDVHRIYSNTNKGMYAIDVDAEKYIWDRVDRIVYLEDDSIPSVSFFRFCQEMLERYKDDERICMISGFNPEGISKNVESDYFFSQYMLTWGIATWRRVAKNYTKFQYKNDLYARRLLKQRTRFNRLHYKQICQFAEFGKYDGHVPGIEFLMQFNMYGMNQMAIIPKKNMISNIGYGLLSTHGDKLERLPRGIRRVYNMKTYEMHKDIIHPSCMMPDLDFDHRINRINGFDNPFRYYWRMIEYGILIIKDGDFEYLFFKCRNKINKMLNRFSGDLIEK